MHLNAMNKVRNNPMSYDLRISSEPSPPPIQDPIDPPENPDIPIREPEPDEPNQI